MIHVDVVAAAAPAAVAVSFILGRRLSCVFS